MSEENKSFKSAENTMPNGGRGPMRRGGPPMAHPVEKAKDFKGTLKRLLKYLMPQKTSLIIVVIFAVVATSFTVLGPKISGTAMNAITDGFVAKSVVDGLDKAQPGLADALKANNDAIKNGTEQADAAVEKAVNDAFAGQKTAAYAKAKAQADAAAKAAVDQKYAAASGLPANMVSKLPGYADALKAAYSAAEAQAKAAVDAAFASKQSDMDSQTASAKKAAEQKVKDAVDKAFMDKQGMTKEQLDTFLSLAALPQIKSTDDYNERADIAKKFFEGMKTLPSSMVSGDSSIKSSNLNLTNISDDNLNRFIKDIRETGGNIPYKTLENTLILLLCIYFLSSVLPS